MAPISGFISLFFTPNYLGDHRLCWRIGAGAYTCFTFTCPNGIGQQCTVNITPITFENESCDSVDYNGYIQASCEDPLTEDGAVFWSHTFVPQPSCVPYVVTCIGEGTSNGISTISLTGEGSLAFNGINYSECICPVEYNTNLTLPPVHTIGMTLCGVFNGIHQSSACRTGPNGGNSCGGGASGPNQFYCSCIYKPSVTITGGGGTGATAEAIIGYGAVTTNGLTVTNSGIGGAIGINTYTVSPVNNTVLNPGPQPGFGNQLFSVTTQNGSVINVTPLPTPQGRYFAEGETFTFSSSSIGGCSGVICVVKTGGTDYGTIIGFNITNQGSGYTSSPTVILSSLICNNINDPYSYVTSITVITTSATGPCPAYYPGEGCEPFDFELPIIPSLPVGSEYTMCYPSGTDLYNLGLPPSYDYEEGDGCCYDCVQVQVVTTELPTVITYTNCDTQNVTVTSMSNLGLVLNCVLRDSWVSNNPNSTTFTELGPCIT